MPLICSIWPMAEKADRPLFQPDPVYFMPAALDGGLSLVPSRKGEEPRVYPGLRIRHQKQKEYIGSGRWTDIHIDADAVARDILGQFTRGKTVPGMPDGAGPGIWLHPHEQASEQQILASPECARARQALNLLANAMVQQARQMLASSQGADVGASHRAMARYLRVEEDWVNPLRREDWPQCRFCTKPAPASAIKCPNCGGVLDVARFVAEEQKIEVERQKYLVVPAVSAPVIVAAQPQPQPQHQQGQQKR